MSFKVGSIDVIHTQVNSPENDPNYRGLHPGGTKLEKGYKKDPECAAFVVDTIWDRDIEIPLRDGVKLRADIFRPATSESSDQKVPALIGWSPYGKTGQGQHISENNPTPRVLKTSRLSQCWCLPGACRRAEKSYIRL